MELSPDRAAAECTSFPQVLDMVTHSPCIGILPKLAKAQAETKGCRWTDVKEFQGEEISVGVACDKNRAKVNLEINSVLKWLLG